MPVARHFDTKHGCAGVLLEKRRPGDQLQRFFLKAWAPPDEIVGVSSDHGPLRIMMPFFHANYNRQKGFEKKIFEDPKHISSSTPLLVIYL